MFLTKEKYFLMKVKYFLLKKVKYFSIFFLCININKNGGLVVLLMWLPDGFVGVTILIILQSICMMQFFINGFFKKKTSSKIPISLQHVISINFVSVHHLKTA